MPIVFGHESQDAKTSLMTFINFVTENGINSPAVTQLRFKVWFQGYQQSKIRTPIYSDVPNKLRVWFSEGIKFYVFSNTWVEAQKALLQNTTHGDLTNLISGHYDNDFGSLTESDSWRRLCGQIHEQPSDVLFLTKSVQEARAAAEAGLAVVLVLTHRHNVKAVSREDRQRFAYVRTLMDLVWLENPTAVEQPVEGGVPAGGIPTAISMTSSVQKSPTVASAPNTSSQASQHRSHSTRNAASSAAISSNRSSQPTSASQQVSSGRSSHQSGAHSSSSNQRSGSRNV